MTPRTTRRCEKIRFRKYGYGTKAAADELGARGYPISPTMLRRAADAGKVAFFRSPGGHRRFLAESLEQFLVAMLDKAARSV